MKLYLKLYFLDQANICGKYDEIRCYEHLERLEIISAVLTARSSKVCGKNQNGPLCGTDGSEFLDITAHVYEKCNLKIKCGIRMSSFEMSDPCPGVKKYISIRWRCRPRTYQGYPNSFDLLLLRKTLP